MAKLSRVFQKQFGLNGDVAHFGEFGSRAAGSPFNTKDPATIQALAAFITNGWLDAINTANKAPFLEDMNSIMYLLFYQICYGMQEGIPEWDASTTYFTGSIVKKPGTMQLYGSSIDNNLNNALPNQVNDGNWQYLNPQSVSPGTISQFAGITVPPGSLLCDGTSYLQTVQPNLFAAIGHTWDTFNGNTSPGAGSFRVPDLRGLTLIGVGSGNGLTPRTLAQFLGEETHLLVIGEMPSHNHSVSDPGHRHSAFGDPSGQVTNGGSGQNTMGRVGSPIVSDVQSNTTGISVAANGGGGAHNNMQPNAGVYHIIKT